MKQRRRSPRSACLLAGLGAALIAGTSIETAAATSAQVAGPAMLPLAVLRGSAAPSLPRGTVRLGPVRTTQRLSLQVTLRLPHPEDLGQYIADLSDRSSPLFHRFLRRGQFGAMFGPSLSEIRGVESVLRREGLTVSSVAPDRLSLGVEASVGAVEKAFHVAISTFRLPTGRIVSANTGPPEIPASVSSSVQGVLGLNNLARVQSLVARAPEPPLGRHGPLPARMRSEASTGGAKPCPDATAAARSNGSFTADELASYYGMTPLYGLGDLGQGVRVALAEFEPDSATDISTYETCYGLTTSVLYRPVGELNPDTTDPGAGEAALDIEDVIGLAPGATIDVYQAPNANDIYSVYEAIVNDDTDPVVSSSWGLCELDSSPTLLKSEEALFAQAAAQGQTVFAAAGDSGSTDCAGDPGTAHGSTPSVDDPASQPDVVGVGGTTIGADSQTVWNDSSGIEGAGGGGVSTSWCMPLYQDQAAIPGLINTDSVADPSKCGVSAPYLRQVPDVSADADPNSGYTIYYSGSGTGFTGWGAIGGTSAAAPLWAAVAALIDASPFCTDYGSNVGADAGVRPQGLYQVASANASYIYAPSAEGLLDITSGTNSYSPSGYTGALYRAGTGYDMASGLGTPLVSGFAANGTPSNFYPGLAALMCRQYATALTSSSITGISPRSGAVGTSTTVTVTGTGFLPIPGADVLLEGSKAVVATCSSTTTCTAEVTSSSPVAVDLRMMVEDYFAESPVTSADEFTFAVAPTETPPPSVSPRPTVEVSAPSQVYQLSKLVVVRYSTTDASSAVASYDVRYRVTPWSSGSPGNWVYPAAWQGTGNTLETLPGTSGNEYCFDVRARSTTNVVSPWSRDHCSTLPVGAAALAVASSGWSRRKGANYYLGSYLETTKQGAELQLSNAQANGLALIVTKCRNCGSVAVYLNGNLLTTVSTYHRTIEHGAIIHLPSFPPRRVTIVLRAATKAKWLIVEGLGISR